MKDEDRLELADYLLIAVIVVFGGFGVYSGAWFMVHLCQRLTN